MTSHTPGPWRVGDDGDVIWGAEWKGNAVHVAATPFSLEPRVKADARLIAAAPELLSLLERIRDDRSWRTNDNALWTDLLTAIAKATGATP